MVSAERDCGPFREWSAKMARASLRNEAVPGCSGMRLDNRALP